MLKQMLQSITAFLDDPRAGYADTTKTLYRYFLLNFTAWLGANHLTLASLTPASLPAWLDAHGWQGDTRYTAACAVRAFLRACCGSACPALAYKVRRRKPRPQRTLTCAQVRALLASLNTARASGVRNLALVTFMLDTGFRAAEACRLQVRDLDLERKIAWSIVKGGEWGGGVFSAYTASCLAGWLPVRDRLAWPGVANVFLGVETHTGRPLTPAGLRSTFKALGKRAGIGPLSPHDLRRTFCVMMLEAGAPTRLVQLAGRWSNLEMVERYSKMLSALGAVRYSPVMTAMGLPDPGR